LDSPSNGNPASGPKFDYKLWWFERQMKHAEVPAPPAAPVVIAADYNGAPSKPCSQSGGALRNY